MSQLSPSGTAAQPPSPFDERAVARSNRIAAVVIGLLAVVLGFLAGRFNPLLTGSHAAEGARVDALFGVLLGVATVIFVVVQGALLYSVIRFRRRSDDDEGPTVHGHVGLEILWTAVPAAIVTSLAIYSYAILTDIETSAPNALEVQVTGRQFGWDFYYPDRDVHSPELHVPVGRQVHLRMRSADVVHAFWIPDFRVKKDLMPDQVTDARFTAETEGTYPVVCSRLCGVGHAFMRTNAIVQKPDDFANWLYAQQTGANVQAGGEAASPAALGKQVFGQDGCGSCHALKDANAQGTVGPTLDGIGTKAATMIGQPGYKGQAKDAAGFIHESIVNPEAYVEPGYPANVMPKTFGQTLSDKDLQNLVQYLLAQK